MVYFFKTMRDRIVLLIKNKENTRLITNFVSLISVKGVDFLIPLFVLPYLVRTLGIEMFGLISFSTAFTMYFGAIIHYGYSITAVRDIARVRQDKNMLSKTYSEFLGVSIFLLLVSCIILTLFLLIVPSLNEYWELHLYSFFFIAMQSFFPSWFFQGIEKMKFIAYINLSTKILFLVSLWFFVKSPDDYLFVPLLNACAMSISTLVSFIVIHKYLKISFIKPTVSQAISVLSKGQHSFIVQLAPTLYNSTAMFLLGYTSTNTLVGIYASATKLIDALNSIAVLLSSTFLPYLSRNIKKHIYFSRIMIVVGILLSGLAAFFSNQLIVFFFSEENLIVSKYFRYLTPMVLFIFIRFTYGPNYLMLIGKDIVYKNVVLYSCIAFFLIALVLVPHYEIYGAIAILLGTSFVMAVLTFFYYRKNYEITGMQ